MLAEALLPENTKIMATLPAIGIQGEKISKPSLFPPNLMLELLARGLLVALWLLWSKVYPPFIRIVQPRDWQLYAFPYTPNTVDHELMLVVVCVLFGAVVFSCNTIMCHRLRERWNSVAIVNDAVNSMLGFTFAIAAAEVVVSVIKINYGRPRPDFLSRCFPNKVYDGSEPPFYPTSGVPVCDEAADHFVVLEGRKSFPSGHTTAAFSSAIFTALYVAHNMPRMVRLQNVLLGKLCTGLLALLPAIFVGVSRTFDYRHHVEDVVVGALIGTGSAMLGREYLTREFMDVATEKAIQM
ncbi:MAG: hypothetical protein KVP17_004159 [Porospora cf. gigantea B]|uniref:uncharacterized protein n=1 Tax=Porospora cf. gigantea B TaxID=2853592 RepID=UPI003571EB01|nr:MAG: hypothetical protein KVP17_004159 [Porospora cf. gigantea B]